MTEETQRALDLQIDVEQQVQETLDSDGITDLDRHAEVIYRLLTLLVIKLENVEDKLDAVAGKALHVEHVER